MLDFTRRINRLTYFLGTLLNTGVLVVGILILYTYDTSVNTALSDDISTFLLLAVFVFFAVYQACLIKQRCDDITGNYAILLFFLLGGLNPLIFFLPGEKKTNQYGPVPHGVQLFK